MSDRSTIEVWRSRALQNRDQIDYLSGKSHRIAQENRDLREQLADRDRRLDAAAVDLHQIKREAGAYEALSREAMQEVERLRAAVTDTDEDGEVPA